MTKPHGSTSSQIKALAFDAYGTLFDVSSVSSCCEGHFPGKGAAISNAWRQKQLEYTWLCSLMERYVDFWELTSRSLRFACRAQGVEPGEEALVDMMESYLRLEPFQEVGAALESLSRSIPLVILSNGTPEMLLKVTRHNGFSGFFKEILSVHALSVYKPSPRVYQMAEESLGLPRRQIGFVSANGWDAAGGRAFGLHTFWINRFDRPRETLGYEPHLEISTLDDLEPLIR